MKDLSVLLDMIHANLAATNNVIENAKLSPESYDQSYLKGYKDATQEIVNLVEKINSHIVKGGK
jgi:hypothetical protein